MSRENIPPFDPQRLQRLGLDPGGLRDSEVLDWSAPQVAEGRGAPQVLLLSALTYLLPVGSALAERLGLSLHRSQERPSAVRVSAAVPLTSRVDATVAVERDVYDPGTLYIDLGASGLVRLSAGVGAIDAVLGVTEGGLGIAECTGAGLALEELPAPPSSWWQESPDRWMADAAQEQLTRASSLGNAVAAGLYLRLERLPAEQTRVLVEAALAGRVAGGAAVVGSWARGLTPGQVAALEELALAASDRWLEHAEALRREADPDDAGWCERLHDACLGRDDLECALAVLRGAGAGQRLASVLESADGLGDRLAGLARDVVLDDERLRRVLVGQPWAWWAQPARLVETE